MLDICTCFCFICLLRHHKHKIFQLKCFRRFVDKAFDRVPRQVLWWAVRRLEVDEWIIQLVPAMYHNNSSSKVCIENCFSDSFGVNVGVHQGSVLSRLLFIMVLEALSQEFRTECP